MTGIIPHFVVFCKIVAMMGFMIFNRKPKRVFLDYASTTPIDRKVLKAMEKYNKDIFANPSALYGEALLAKEKLNESRQKIADILNCRKSEIVFTSGGTESNNLAILGIFEAFKKPGFTPHIIVSVIEHSSILEACKEVEKRGGEVTYLPVSGEGLVSAKDVKVLLKDNTVLVSIMYANNEIGTVEPIKEIGKMLKDYKREKNSSLPYFHTDACQAVNYFSVDVLRLGVDLLTLDGIKMYGPRSSGLLYVKSGTEINPIIFGGGQESGFRSGTENVSSILGLSIALELSSKLREKESLRLIKLRDYAIEEILKNFPKATLNGSKEFRLPNNINICFPSLDAEFAVISLDVLGCSVSYSSSCLTLKEDSSSYVVSSLGKDDCKNSSLRFTLGRESTKKDIDRLVTCLRKIMIL
jgi:cysteine desulfurase